MMVWLVLIPVIAIGLGIAFLYDRRERARRRRLGAASLSPGTPIPELGPEVGIRYNPPHAG